MTDPVERVARAICREVSRLLVPDLEDNILESGWEQCLPSARAAIAAMPGEPVAWRYRFITSVDGKEWSDWFIVDDLASVPHRTQEQIQPLYAAPAMPATDAVREALRALYEWYDRDGSVGGASDVFEDYRDVVTAALCHPSQGGWQPIETAPKDGTSVLLFTTTAGDAELTEYLKAGGDDEIPLERVQCGVWDGEDWHGANIIGNPTHWQPLPAPPEVQP